MRVVLTVIAYDGHIMIVEVLTVVSMCLEIAAVST